MANLPKEHVFDLEDGDEQCTGARNKGVLCDAKAFVDKNGCLIAKIFEPHGPECIAAVGIIVREVIAKYPRAEKLEIVTDDGVKIDYDDPANDQALYDVLCRGKLSPRLRKSLKKQWPPGYSFGAITSAKSLYNTFSNDFRFNWKLRKFCEAILAHASLWVSLDRVGAKLPEAGEDEEPHVDEAPTGTEAAKEFAKRRLQKKDGLMVQGKFCVSTGSFRFCFGSHTTAAADEMNADKANLGKKQNLIKIDGVKFPPTFLWVESGCVALWLNGVHEVRKRASTAPVEFVLWVGMQDAWPREFWGRMARVAEDVERKRSLTTGTMMARHPSGFVNPLTNLRYDHQKVNEANKRAPGCPSVVYEQTANGKIRIKFLDVPDPNFVMQNFSAEQEKLLGLRPYSAAEMAATDVVLRRLVEEANALGGSSGAAGGAAGGARASGGAGGAAGGSRAAEKAAAGAPGKCQAVASDSDSDDGTAAGAPAAKRQAAWQCASCTLINDAGARACEACLTMRQV